MARAKENNYVLPQARAMEWYNTAGRGFYVKEDKEHFLTYLTPDGINLYAIPTEKFLLDKERCTHIGIGTTLEEGAEKVTPGVILDEGSRKVRIFERPKGEGVRINEAFYKDFQKIYAEYFQRGEVEAYAQGPTAPVMFVRNEVVIGLILPIRPY